MNQGLRATATHKIRRNRDNEYFDIKIHVSELRAANLSHQTWGSAHVLANRLCEIDIDPDIFISNKIKVIELGAGTGLVGLSAAIIWETDVILTDLSAVVPGLAKNIGANESSLVQNRSRVQCGTLDWENPTDLHLMNQDLEMVTQIKNCEENKVSVILAADTVYSEDHPLLVSQTIFAWLKRHKSTRAIISCPLRIAYLDAIRELWERLEAGGLEAVAEGKAEADDDFDDEKWHEWSVWRWKDP